MTETIGCLAEVLMMHLPGQLIAGHAITRPAPCPHCKQVIGGMILGYLTKQGL